MCQFVVLAEFLNLKEKSTKLQLIWVFIGRLIWGLHVCISDGTVKARSSVVKESCLDSP
jgi:hypothetical protein